MAHKLKLKNHAEPSWPHPSSSSSFLDALRTLHFQLFATFLTFILLVSFLLHSFSSHRLLTEDPQIDAMHVVSEGNVHTTITIDSTSDLVAQETDQAFSCDRSHHRTDVCQMKGDVRVDGRSSSVLLNSPERAGGILKEEKVRPYTRKWETSIMNTIQEVSLRRMGNSTAKSIPDCGIRHLLPAILFSTGGYTGNVYHEFNDGLIPLFISSQHLKGEVVFIILEYHEWWMTKYGEIIGQLTNHQILDLSADKRVHCFPEIMVGLRIHDELAIDPKLMKEAVSMKEFQRLLHRAYLPRLQSKPTNSAQSLKKQEVPLPSGESKESLKRPKLVIISRKSPRAMLNQKDVTGLAKQIGFDVEILVPKRSTEMVNIYRIVNSCDAMIGVHGAAMTHLLFMRPGATLIQIVPLGTNWAASTYYGEPARKLGLNYVEYKISPEESSLSDRYSMDDPVLMDPESVNKKGWWETKRVYLNGQDVRLSLDRFHKTLQSAYSSA